MRKSNSYTVITSRNRHGTMMLRGNNHNETVFVVECADTNVENVLDDVGVGSEIRADLERVGRRGNSWCATSAECLDTQRIECKEANR